MRRFPTVIGLLLLVGIIFGAIYYFQGRSSKVSSEIIPKNVRVTNVADNKFSVSWTTETPTVGQVEYGQVGEKLGSVAGDDRDSKSTAGQYQTHHVTIDSLQPSTQYAFRILVGQEKPVRFDNNGSPYTAATGPVIGATPKSESFYGNVELPSNAPASGALVYLTLPGAAVASTLVDDSGNYAVTISTIRGSDLRTYVKYDPSATVASVSVVTAQVQSSAAVSLANAAPVPLITLGQNAEFLNPALTGEVAQVEAPVEAPEQTPTAPNIFNVEPLANPDINVVGTGSVTILNPKEEGETLKTLRPEFRGTGTSGTTISIAITGQKSVSDTVKVGSDGTWSFAPVIDLKTGAQTITVSYTGTGGTAQKVMRGFVVSTSTTGLDPAFVSSPSASTKPAASKVATSSATPTPRAAMPSTSSGVPVTGVIENTLLTAGLGIVMMVVAAALLVL